MKIRGLKPAARRRAVFVMCGYDEAAQAEFDAHAAVAGEQRDRQRAFDEARERASQARYRLEDQSVISGAELVERSIEQGFAEIRSYPRGAAKVYMLVNHSSRTVSPLSVRNGTLAYARAVLERRGA